MIIKNEVLDMIINIVMAVSMCAFVMNNMINSPM